MDCLALVNSGEVQPIRSPGHLWGGSNARTLVKEPKYGSENLVSLELDSHASMLCMRLCKNYLWYMELCSQGGGYIVAIRVIEGSGSTILCTSQLVVSQLTILGTLLH